MRDGILLIRYTHHFTHGDIEGELPLLCPPEELVKVVLESSEILLGGYFSEDVAKWRVSDDRSFPMSFM